MENMVLPKHSKVHVRNISANFTIFVLEKAMMEKLFQEFFPYKNFSELTRKLFFKNVIIRYKL